MRFFRGHHGLLRSMILVVACGSFALLMASARLYASIAATGYNPVAPLQAKEITLLAGDIFEMTTVNAYRAPLFSWVLTKDRMFLSSSREPIFRSRFIEPGLYRIDGDVQDGASGDEQRTALFVNVTRRPFVPGEGSGSVSSSFAPSQDPITTDPPLSGSTLTIATGSTIVAITPSASVISAYTLTIDLPGTPSVNITNGTYSQTQGTPLYAWFLQSTGTYPMHLIATTPDGTNLQREYVAVIGSDGPATPPAPTTGLLGRVGENGAVTFSLNRFDENGAPLLYRWSFGDGTASLAATPTHLFSSSGTYLVSVTVTDLRTFQPVASAQTNFNIQAVRATTGPRVTSSSASSHSSVSSNASAATSSTSSGSAGGSSAFSFAPMLHILLWVIVILLGIVVASVIAWLIVKFINREGILQDQLEKAEQRIAGGTGAGMTPEPPPLEIKRVIAPKSEPEVVEKPTVAVTERSTVTQESVTHVETQPTPPEETIDVDNAPSWLRHGLEMAKTPDDATPEAQPATTEHSEVIGTMPVQTIASPAVTETSDAQSTAEPLPDWLKPASAPPEPSPVTPEPAPTIAVTSVIPAPLPPEHPEPTPLPESPSIQEPKQNDAATPPPVPVIPETAPASVAAPNPSLPNNDDLAAPSSTPAIPSVAPAQNSAEREREERERERKRRKRQRYRDNLKKRKIEEKASPTLPQPGASTTQSSPAPTVTEPTLPSSPESHDVPALITQPAATPDPSVETPKTAEPAPPPSQVAPQRAIAPDPNAVSAKDDQIVFVVEAPDLSKKNGGAPNTTPTH